MRPATAVPGQSAPAPNLAADGDANFLPTPDRLPMGPQSVGLTINVISPQTLNVNKPAVLKIVVKNTGPTEALGVVVRDVMPDGVTFVSSQPEATKLDSILTWRLGSVPAGTERVIVVNVTPTRALV